MPRAHGYQLIGEGGGGDGHQGERVDASVPGVVP